MVKIATALAARRRVPRFIGHELIPSRPDARGQRVHRLKEGARSGSTRGKPSDWDSDLGARGQTPGASKRTLTRLHGRLQFLHRDILYVRVDVPFEAEWVGNNPLRSP